MSWGICIINVVQAGWEIDGYKLLLYQIVSFFVLWDSDAATVNVLS